MIHRFILASLFCLGASATAFSQQQELFPMGLPTEPDEYYNNEVQVKAKLTNSNYRDIASKASVKQYAPIPQSQGQYGTCAAWATGYCARTILEAKRYGWTDKKKITENVFAYGFIYRITSSSAKCWGAYTSKCVENMKNIGIPKLTDYSVHCPQDDIPDHVYQTAAKYKIKDFVKLWDDYTNTSNKERIDAAKKSLAEGNPIAISMICPSSFHYPQGDVWTPTESPNDNPDHPHGRHAMCVVGYDDDKYGGAFEIQNSWGEDWCNGGYIWVRYKDFADFVYQAVELIHFDPVVNQDVALSGSLRFQLDTGKDMAVSLNSEKTYKMSQAYRSGTRFRLYITNNEPAYVYAFGSDLTAKTYQIFPHRPEVSAALTYSRNDVALPSEENHIRMDNNVGTDYMCVLYSKEPLNVDEIRKNVENQSSIYSFKQRVENAVGSKLMKGSEINYSSSGKISFNGKAKGKSVAALFVEIEHIE